MPSLPATTESGLHYLQIQLLRPCIGDAEQLVNNTKVQATVEHKPQCSSLAPDSLGNIGPKHDYGVLVQRGACVGMITRVDATGNCSLVYISNSPNQSNSQNILPLPTWTYILTFLMDVLPRQIHLHIHLRLPSFYFSRVARVFEEAELSMQEIEDMAYFDTDQSTSPAVCIGSILPRYVRLRAKWEHLVDSLMREWRTLSVVSAFLISVILGTLQISMAYKDPISRNIGLLALVCTAMSLLYACIYVFQFKVMRRAQKAVEWAKEAQKTRTPIFWNVWIFLAMPSVWLSWSVIFYLASIFALAKHILVNKNDDDLRLQVSSATQTLRMSVCMWGLYFVGRFFGLGASNWCRQNAQATGTAQRRETA